MSFEIENNVLLKYIPNEDETDVIIPDGVIVIDEGAFGDCTTIRSVKIPDSVQYILEAAFMGCGSLEEITIPKTVKKFSRDVFCNTKGYDDYPGDFIIEGNNVLLEYKGKDPHVVIPEGVTEINEYAFHCCDFIKSVVIPKSVEKIGAGAFHTCKSLKKINIPESVTEIGNYAFFKCQELENIDLPSSIKNIDICAFEETPFYRTFTDDFVIIGDNVLIKCNLNEPSIVIPDGVKYIGGNIFYSCEFLESVTIPDSVTRIGNSAFYGCRNLSSVHIPDTVTYIGRFAFNYCNKIKSVTIPKGVTKIECGVFSNCRSLSTVTICGDVTEIGNSAFDKCIVLKSINIPDSVEIIDDSAFLGCKEIVEINLPSKLTRIGDKAFFLCVSLKSIVIPDTVTYLGEDAFKICTSLKDIKIPDTLNYIGDNAFSRTPWMDSHKEDFVIVGNSILIKYQGSEKNVTIPEGVKQIAECAFGKSCVKSVIIPNTVTAIHNCAFFRSPDLESVEIPESVTKAGSNVFFCCPALSELTVWGLKFKSNYIQLIEFDLRNVIKILVNNDFGLKLSPTIKRTMAILLYNKNKNPSAEKYLRGSLHFISLSFILNNNYELLTRLLDCEEFSMSEERVSRLVKTAISNVQRGGDVAIQIYLMNYYHKHFPNGENFDDLYL